MSPGFEVNDAGYSTQTDRAGGHAHGPVPQADARPAGRASATSGCRSGGRGTTATRARATAGRRRRRAQFRNIWRSPALFTYAKRVWDDKLTRGGPTVIRPGNRGMQLATVTDSRKKLVFTLGRRYTARDYDASSAAVDVQVAWRPFPALTLSTGPSFRHNVVSAQYLATIADPLATRTYGSRYVFGELEQTEYVDGDAGESRHLAAHVAAGLPAAARLGGRLRGDQGGVRAAHLRLRPLRRRQRQHDHLDARARCSSTRTAPGRRRRSRSRSRTSTCAPCG